MHVDFNSSLLMIFNTHLGHFRIIRMSFVHLSFDQILLLQMPLQQQWNQTRSHQDTRYYRHAAARRHYSATVLVKPYKF